MLHGPLLVMGMATIGEDIAMRVWSNGPLFPPNPRGTNLRN